MCHLASQLLETVMFYPELNQPRQDADTMKVSSEERPTKHRPCEPHTDGSTREGISGLGGYQAGPSWWRPLMCARIQRIVAVNSLPFPPAGLQREKR